MERILTTLMRIYALVTIALLATYFFLRIVTPLWLDMAFIAWCLVFLLVWAVFSRRKQENSDSNTA